MSQHIKPPQQRDCTWHDGPPPEVGWWPASRSKNPKLLRYWNGSAWSHAVPHTSGAVRAGSIGKLLDDRPAIQWCARWWP